MSQQLKQNQCLNNNRSETPQTEIHTVNYCLVTKNNPDPHPAKLKASIFKNPPSHSHATNSKRN